MIIGDAILGLSLIKFLLHLLNFAVLFVALWLILYKPVLNFIKKRQDFLREQREASDAKLAEAEIAKAQYEVKLSGADAEIEQKTKEAEKRAGELVDTQILAAKSRASQIVNDAEATASAQKDRIMADAKSEIVEMAVELASTIIGREFSREDNEKLIDGCIAEWSKND